MSILIAIEKAVPIEAGLILPEIEKVLCSLLGLTFTFTLQVVDRFDENKVLDEACCIGPGQGCLWGIKCLEEQAIISVSTRIEKEYVYFSPDGWRTPLEYALAPAAAIA